MKEPKSKLIRTLSNGVFLVLRDMYTAMPLMALQAATKYGVANKRTYT